MNLAKPLRAMSRASHSVFLRLRAYLPRRRCIAFMGQSDQQAGIGQIFVINLDRQPRRWADMMRELGNISDASGTPLSQSAVRQAACDAKFDPLEVVAGADVDPLYTLGDQLFVEPQPHAIPDAFDLEQPIRMSQAEIAVACSHIGVWKRIAEGSAAYSLVLEDDVWFERALASTIEKAWREMQLADRADPQFDILYLSYDEVRFGAPKELISENLFRPERGLWFLSGYVLSKKGAKALLDLLPCRGPVDLWINHKFRNLDVRALRRSLVNQRRDLHSTNSYSILPALSRIGVLDTGDASLFHGRTPESPVFAFGAPGSGLSSLATALSMLGYRCCSDLETLPDCELDRLITGRSDRVFDAYVNIGSLAAKIPTLTRRYPHAKFIVIDQAKSSDVRKNTIPTELAGTDLLCLHSPGWRDLCEHLKLAPPDAPYPSISDIGLRALQSARQELLPIAAKQLRHDPSPWIVRSRKDWAGISVGLPSADARGSRRSTFDDDFADIDNSRWLMRNDTFPGNLGLFRPANVAAVLTGGLSLTVMEEALGVRNLSAASISSRSSYLYGRFEATLQATNIPGLVTGFFLHRNSPRQEIDVEILGSRPDRLLVNVFYNPGSEGAKFDYGYRGTPAVVPLGFDASKAPHQFAIEWDPGEIRWFVDQKLVHRRVVWCPTPIPHLPMKLHVNTWPSRSRELAGQLALRALPASAIVKRVSVDAFVADILSGQSPGASLGAVVGSDC